jgi:hypothetical protein
MTYSHRTRGIQNVLTVLAMAINSSKSSSGGLPVGKLQIPSWTGYRQRLAVALALLQSL